MVEKRAYTVSAVEAGLRLDSWVCQRFELGRAGAQRWVREGRLRVNGAPCVKGQRVREGDEIVVQPAVEDGIVAEPEASLTVRLLRHDLVVVDKPAGQATAPLRYDERGSLAGALLGRFPELAGIGYRLREPGLVHRLDTGTSGLVLAARTASSFERLVHLLQAGALHKRYLALVRGTDLPATFDVTSGLGPAKSGGRVELRPARTAAEHRTSRVRVVSRSGNLTLVEVLASRAYRHQVRVHLASQGFPIVGDALYGGPPHPELVGRHALHASRIACEAGSGCEPFDVTSPLPDAFHRALVAAGAG